MKVKKTIIGIVAVLLVCALGIGGYQWYLHYQEQQEILRREQSLEAAYESLVIVFREDAGTLEYGSSFSPAQIIESRTGRTIKTTAAIDTMKTGPQTVSFTISDTDEYGQDVSRDYSYQVEVIDTRPPEIEIEAENAEITEGDEFDPVSNIVSVTDPVDGEIAYSDSLQNGAYTVITDLDTGEPGEYEVTVAAKDKNGLEAERSYTVTVNKYVPPVSSTYPYYIRINRALNTVTIYTADINGDPIEPIKAMVCSTGTYTPLGTYRTYYKARWNALFGGVWGQYSAGITGDILFHSVPYYSQNIADLEYDEYNKLGTSASLGCVRLCVADAKWIYDNCPVGTVVVLYDDESDPGPLGKPTPITIDTSDPRRGWDPTDPDPGNPWNEG